MVKKLVSLATAFLLLLCTIPLSAFADDVLDVCPKCGKRSYETWRDFSTTVPDLGFPLSGKFRHCTSCDYTYYDWNCLGFTGYKDFDHGGDGFLKDYIKEFMSKNLGSNANLKPYQTGGGSAGTGGVGRHPSGYADDTGTPSVNPSGAYTISAPLRLYPTRFNTTSGNDYVSSLSLFDNYSVSKGNLAVVGSTTGIRVTNGGSTDAYIIFGGGYRVNVPAAGYIGVSKVPKAYIGMGTYLYESADAKELWSIEHPFSTSYSAVFGRSVSEQGVCFVKFDIDSSSGKTSTEDFISSKIEASYQIPYYDSSYKKYRVRLALILWIPHNSETFFAYNSIPVSYVPSTTTINQTNNITINNNTWNGNIYQDNSTNLTYIYPQYTTVNENNETVTNISNNPIIYNNETKQYYTYDSVTNNYYYITYETPSPSPSPDPDPTPTPGPGGDTGDTTGILAVLVEIRDNMIQGFADIKATLVQGWADLSANFTLAIENLNVNIQNIFNKKFPDQSTPETPLPSPTHSPSPEPVDPILPETQNLIIPKMNSNTFADEHGTWVASGSSKYSDVFDFFYAFDRSTANFWETNASPSHLQIEIPDPESYYIDGYIMRISKFNNRYAKDWTLQGSDDSKTWDDLDKQTGQNLSDKEEHKYTLTLRKAYKYYRVNMSNYASSMCSLSHFNLLGYDAKDVVTPTPSPSPAPDPGTDPTPVPTPSGGTVPAPGGDSNISGGDDEGLFGWLWDLLKDLVKAILKAIFKILSNILGFLIWIVERVGLLLPFLPAPAIAALGAGVVLIFVIRIIRFIRG